MKPNAVECHVNYMQTQIRLPQKDIKIKAFVGCIVRASSLWLLLNLLPFVGLTFVVLGVVGLLVP